FPILDFLSLFSTRRPLCSTLFPYTTLFRSYVHLNGKIHYQKYERGVPLFDLKVIGDTDRTGTTIHFKPDPEIFTETVVYDFEVLDRKSTRLNSSHVKISYAVFCLKKKKKA